MASAYLAWLGSLSPAGFLFHLACLAPFALAGCAVPLWSRMAARRIAAALAARAEAKRAVRLAAPRVCRPGC